MKLIVFLFLAGSVLGCLRFKDPAISYLKQEREKLNAEFNAFYERFDKAAQNSDSINYVIYLNQLIEANNRLEQIQLELRKMGDTSMYHFTRSPR